MNRREADCCWHPYFRTFSAALSISGGCAPVEMWLVGEVGVGTMLGDEVLYLAGKN